MQLPNQSLTRSGRVLLAGLMGLLLACNLAQGQFVAYNDHAPGTIGVTTHSNATTWNVLRSAPGATGPLRDIQTGAALPVTVTITTNGFLNDGSSAANPNSNTPLYNVFNGYVDFRASGRADAVVQIYSNATVTYTFSGLNPKRTYSFMGSTVRGGSGGTYPQRWTLFQLEGAQAFKSAHTAGCYTNGLAANQVAINTGMNLNGDMVDWETIIPGTNGSFRVASTQYTGPIPAGGTASGPYGYALNGFRLMEFAPPTITSVHTPDNNTLQVVFSLPVLPATATNLANYSLTNYSGPVALLGATLDPDGQTVRLTTASQAPFAGHWLNVRGITDAATGLSVIAPDTQILFQAVPFTAGYIKRELYLSISNSTVASLTNSAKFPNSPDQIDYLRNLSWPQENIGTNYGARLSGWLVPPLSGDYYFALRNDDTAQLWLSPNADPAARSLLINAATCCQPFDTYTNGPIPLIAGQRYYLEALMKENSGSDYLQVAWKMPTNMAWTIIPGQHLGNYLSVINSTLFIRQQPTNTSVLAGQRATFAVAATGTSSITTNVSYQWQLNGFDIPGAVSAVYTTPLLSAGDNGAVYRVLVSVPGRGQFSSSAVLSVLPDADPPAVVDVFSLGPTNVQLRFSEPLAAASATNRLNYSFSGGIAVSRATLNADQTRVTLTTSPLIYGSNYSIQLNQIRDQASPPNTIPANTLVTFQALPYARQDFGSATSTVTLVSNGVNLVVAGSEIGGLTDQCHFSYQLRIGDFDVCVRLAGLDWADLWAQAGLMAREALDAGSRFAATLATPGLNGTSFQSRAPAYSPARSSGSVPVNYPHTWLRLQRVGPQFSGYASYDGQTWTLLGSDSIAMPSQVYVGLAVSSHSTNQTTFAQFRDIAEVSTNSAVGLVPNPHEPLGPSSRKTPLVISEILYKPAPRADTNNLEFIELYNSNPWFHDLSGYQLRADTLAYTFPPGTTLAGGAFLVVAAAPQNLQSVYNLTNLLGPYTGSLKKSDTLQLLDEQGALLLTIPYSTQPPWPVGADATGHSLVLAHPTYGEEDPRAWAISDQVGGSPGQMEAFRPSPLRQVVINEFLAHTDLPDYDYIELYNHANTPLELGGCILSDDFATNKFVIPSGTVIPARGHVAFYETNLHFALNAAGETLYLKSPDQRRVLDAVAFGGQENGVATGRWPDGAQAFYRLSARSPGGPNGSVRLSPVVLNELMYHPLSGNDDDQYIELYNRSGTAVDLSGWTLSEAVSFTFPSNTVLAADSYLVVARNIARLLTNYPNLTANNTLGDFNGKLSGRGERLVLNQPDTIIATNRSGQVETNRIAIAVAEVAYSAGGRWGQWADGGGSSLELMDPNANPRLAANWADSDETRKSSWVNIETTGVLDHGRNYDPFIHYAQIGLLDVGECLVDNIEVHPGTAATNYVLNPDFETGLTNWIMQGCHLRSSLEPEGYASSRSLRIRASNQMWTGDNSCELTLSTNNMAAGQTVTLRFKARWLRGWPEVLLRLNGNWLEATGRLPVPANLGTPGARNSRYISNVGPAIFEVTHTPTVPAANQPVVVTARVHDPQEVQSLTLRYRTDPALTYTAVSLRDDGLGGDAMAGDGLYSATIPAPNTNRIVAFYLAATDSLGAATRFPALLDNNSPPRECVVMFGDSNPAGSFGVYHLWITQTNVTRWISQSDLSNESWDCTFVTHNRVIYNTEARYAGSPYHQGFDTPYGKLCHYKWTFPEDDKFLGVTSFNKIHQPGNGAGDDLSLQREQTAHTFLRALGVPWLNRRYVAVYVNGNRRGPLMEDTQCPDSTVVKEYFPDDSDGWLYKMQPWFEFAPAPKSGNMAFTNVSWCNLMPYTTTGGVKKAARYRYNFLIRRSLGSANDFTNAFSLVDAAASHGSPNYVANLENLANMENWMRVFAANHAAGNWDSFGARNAQNLYGYLGAKGTKYSLLMWDFNIVLGNSGSWGPGQNLFTVNTQDPNTANIYNNPTFRRMYWRALQELINGPLDVAKTGPLLDAKYNAFLANGLTVEHPNSIKSWLSQAQASIAAQLAAENASAFAVTPTVVTNNGLAYLTGTAPVAVKSIQVNGVDWPLTWTSVSGWRVTVPLHAVTNQFTVVGLDRQGQPIPGTTNTIPAPYLLVAPPDPLGQVVINEIMYHPSVANAEYVELYNQSLSTTFDLSGWEFRGLSYTFPPGSLLGPNSFLVLAANRAAFAAAYGATIPIFDTFSGMLQTDGETLTLVKPGSNGSNEVVITRVRYRNTAPWPAGADGFGSSLQLTDPQHDNWRAGNWAAYFPPASYSPGAPNKVLTTLPAFPPLWLNELQAENLTGITNRARQRTPWFELHNPGTNAVALDGLYLANSYTNPTAWAFPTGAVINPGEFKVIFADGQTNLSAAAELHTDFTLSPGAGSLILSRRFNSLLQVLDYLDYANLAPNRSFGSLPDAQSFDRQEFFFVTPGSTNNGHSAPLTAFINEWMADNFHTRSDPADTDYEDWFELYNPGTNSVDLGGCYLTDTMSNRFQFQVPKTHQYVIPPQGYLLVWADGESKQNSTNRADLHVNFKLDKAGELIGLFAEDGTVIDAISFAAQTTDVSEGRFPDGAARILTMPMPTPRASNLVPNHPPVVETISNQVLILGQTLAFTVTAADSDHPPQSLTFALAPGAPATATIHPTLGRFHWTPATAPSTNLIRIVVTDSGLPSLSSPQDFLVTVLPAPRLDSLQCVGSQFLFQWQAPAGPAYQVEYKDNLDSPIWIALETPVTGTGDTLTFTNDLGNLPQRFFRIRVLP